VVFIFWCSALKTSFLYSNLKTDIVVFIGLGSRRNKKGYCFKAGCALGRISLMWEEEFSVFGFYWLVDRERYGTGFEK